MGLFLRAGDLRRFDAVSAGLARLLRQPRHPALRLRPHIGGRGAAVALAAADGFLDAEHAKNVRTAVNKQLEVVTVYVRIYDGSRLHRCTRHIPDRNVDDRSVRQRRFA